MPIRGTATDRKPRKYGRFLPLDRSGCILHLASRSEICVESAILVIADDFSGCPTFAAFGGWEHRKIRKTKRILTAHPLLFGAPQEMMTRISIKLFFVAATVFSCLTNFAAAQLSGTTEVFVQVALQTELWAFPCRIRTKTSCSLKVRCRHKVIATD